MTYSIGQLARTVSTGVETIRFYERRGLMPEPPRTASGYRCYSVDAADCPIIEALADEDDENAC